MHYTGLKLIQSPFTKFKKKLNFIYLTTSREFIIKYYLYILYSLFKMVKVTIHDHILEKDIFVGDIDNSCSFNSLIDSTLYPNYKLVCKGALIESTSLISSISLEKKSDEIKIFIVGKSTQIPKPTLLPTSVIENPNMINITINKGPSKVKKIKICKNTGILKYLDDIRSWIILSGNVYTLEGKNFMTFDDILKAQYGIDYDKKYNYSFFIRPPPKSKEEKKKEQLELIRKQNQFNIQTNLSMPLTYTDIKEIFSGIDGISLGKTECVVGDIHIDDEFIKIFNTELDEYINSSFRNKQKLISSNILDKTKEILIKYRKDLNHFIEYCNVLSSYTKDALNILNYLYLINNLLKKNHSETNFLYYFIEIINAIPSSSYKLDILETMPDDLKKTINFKAFTNSEMTSETDIPNNTLFLPREEQEKYKKIFNTKLNIFDPEFYTKFKEQQSHEEVHEETLDETKGTD